MIDFVKTGYEEKADWFSLGLTIGELLTKTLPPRKIEMTRDDSLCCDRNCSLNFPVFPVFCSENLQNVVKKLLMMHPRCRQLAATSFKNLKYFKT